MWTCPECGRELKKRHQRHFCGPPPESVQAYIAQQPEHVQPFLLQLHEQILSTGRDMVPRIVWHMPTYWKGQNIIQFAAHKDFVSVYAGKEALEAFRDYKELHAKEAAEDFGGDPNHRVTAFDIASGTLRLPYDRPLPDMLIRGLTRWCYRHYALRGDANDGTD